MALAEIQANRSFHPEMPGEHDMLELDTFEDKVITLRVLEAVRSQGAELGGDIAEYVPENIEEEIEEIRHLIFEKADTSVTLQGQVAQDINHLLEAAAESDEFELKDEARYALGLSIDKAYVGGIAVEHVAKEAPLPLHVMSPIQRMKSTMKKFNDGSDNQLIIDSFSKMMTARAAVETMNGSQPGEADASGINGLRVYSGDEAKLILAGLRQAERRFSKLSPEESELPHATYYQDAAAQHWLQERAEQQAQGTT